MNDDRGKCIRGLPCWECNSSLGRIEGHIEAFIKYLKEWKIS